MHQIKLSHGIIEIIYNGEVNRDNHKRILESILTDATQLETSGRPVDFIVDFRKVGKISHNTISLAIKAIRDVNQRKVACIGDNKNAIRVIKIMAEATGKTGKFGFFENKKQATDWLKG